MAKKPPAAKPAPKKPAAKKSAAKKSAAPSNGTTELRDEELRALAFNHKGLYERALAAKKAKDADLRNACKKIKADLGDSGVSIIKAMIELDSPEGEAAVRARIRTQATAARWAGLPVGTQVELSLGEPDRTPAVDRAFDEGKRASMENKPRKPPYDPSVPQYAKWLEGFAHHQECLAAKIGRGNDDKDVRPRHLQQMEADRKADAKPN